MLENSSPQEAMKGQEHSELTFDESMFLELVRQYQINANDKYTEHEYLLERQGIGFSPKGNVMAIAAEKKAGKSWFSMAMCAAFLQGEFLGMKSRVEDGSAIYMDTEQDKIDGQHIQKRVHQVCGWDYDTNNDRFKIFHLREISPENRMEFICMAIKYWKPDMIIVDGVRDLLTDFNDLQQSASIVQEFMRLSSECNTAIWLVLHVNPNSEKMRGHLGTELGNKVADILKLDKHGEDDDVYYTMKETDSRGHKDIKSISFVIDDTPVYHIPKLMTEEEIKDNDDKYKDELRKIMKKYISENSSISFTKLRESLKSEKEIGSVKASRMINDAKALGILIEVANKLMISNAKKEVKPVAKETPVKPVEPTVPKVEKPTSVDDNDDDIFKQKEGKCPF